MNVELESRTCLGSFPRWGKAGMGARPVYSQRVALAPTPTLPQRGRESDGRLTRRAVDH